MKIKPLHKRLIMRWKIIAHNGIVKFMQFPETKEAGGEPRERVEGANSYDEKFCRCFVSFVSNVLSGNSTKQTIFPLFCFKCITRQALKAWNIPTTLDNWTNVFLVTFAPPVSFANILISYISSTYLQSFNVLLPFQCFSNVFSNVFPMLSNVFPMFFSMFF